MNLVDIGGSDDIEMGDVYEDGPLDVEMADVGATYEDDLFDVDMVDIDEYNVQNAPMKNAIKVGEGDIAGFARLELEEVSSLSLADPAKVEKQLRAEASFQAHLKVIDQEAYSSTPMLDRKGYERRRLLRFTNSIRSEPSMQKASVTQRMKKARKSVHYNADRFRDADIKITNERLFDPLLLSPPTDRMDYYLHECLSRPGGNNARIRIVDPWAAAHARCPNDLLVWVSNSSLTYRSSAIQICWNLGSMGPGGRYSQADPNEVQTVLDRVCYILQRLDPLDFSSKKARTRFLDVLLNRVIRHADPPFNMKASLQIPIPQLTEGRLHFTCRPYSYMFQGSAAVSDSASINLEFGNLELRPVHVPYEDRYMFLMFPYKGQTTHQGSGLEGQPVQQDSDSEGTVLSYRHKGWQGSSELRKYLQSLDTPHKERQYRQALRLVQSISCTLEGFLGPSAHMKRFGEMTKDGYGRRQRLDKLYSPYGHAIWILGKVYNWSTLEPSKAVRKDVTGLPEIYLSSNILGRWPPILQAIIDKWVQGGNIVESWQAGISAADHENARIFEGVAPTRVRCRCATNGPSFHPCELCLRALPCIDLRQPPPETSTQRFCFRCFGEACRVIEQRRKKASAPLLLQRLKDSVRDDFIKIHGPEGYHANREQCFSRVKDIWNELEKEAIKNGEIIYAWKDAYAADVCGDSAQANFGSVRQVWLGKIVSPFTASPDGVFQVALDIDGNTGYHIPGNIAITSQAFNYFLDRYPPICLPLTERSRLAQGRSDLDKVAKAFCNLVTTMNSIPKLKKDRTQMVLDEQQIKALHDALRTAQPGPEPRQYYGWHVPGDCYNIGPRTHLRTNTEAHIIYQYTQLRAIQRLPKYQRIFQDDPEFCFKNHVFFPFSPSAPIEYWYEHNNQAFFECQLRMKIKICDRSSQYHYKLNTSLLMFQTYRNCLDMALKNGKKKDGSWTIQDPLGLEPWPMLDMPLTGSIGHIIHGEPMITGYPPGVDFPEDQEDYSPERNNMVWETWGLNHEKQSLGDEPKLLEMMLARHQNLRPAEETIQYWQLVDEVQEDEDYVSKITQARKQWQGRRWLFIPETHRRKEKSTTVKTDGVQRKTRRTGGIATRKKIRKPDYKPEPELDYELDEESEEPETEELHNLFEDEGMGIILEKVATRAAETSDQNESVHRTAGVAPRATEIEDRAAETSDQDESVHRTAGVAPRATEIEDQNEEFWDDEDNTGQYSDEIHRQKLDDIYKPLNNVKSTASQELISTFSSSNQPSNSQKGSTAKAPKLHLDRVSTSPPSIWSLIEDFENWRQLSSDDRINKCSEFLDLLQRENERRQDIPDDSYDRALKARSEPKTKYIQGTQRRKVNLQYLTDYQYHHFQSFWYQKIIELLNDKTIKRN